MANHYKFHNDLQSSVLTYDQVKRLDFVIDQTVPIHGRGQYPTLYVKLKELIRLVKSKLEKEHSIQVRDVRLNGGASNFVLAPENSHYNDLDLIFGIDLTNEDQFDVIRDVVLDCLKEFIPKQTVTPLEQHQSNSRDKLFLKKNNDNHQQQPQKHDKSFNIQQSVTNNYGCCAANNSSSYNSTTITTTTTNFASDNNSNTKNNLKNSPIYRDLTKNSNHHNYQHQHHHQQQQPPTENIDHNNKPRASIVTKSQQNQKIAPTSMKKENDPKNIIKEDKGRNQRCMISTLADKELEPQEISKHVHDATNLQVEASERIARSPQHLQQQQSFQMPLTNCAIKEAYVHKMVKVNDDDRWSLISLGVQPSETTANCGQVNSCCSPSTSYADTSISTTTTATTSVPCSDQTHHVVKSADGQKQFLVTIASNTNNSINDDNADNPPRNHNTSTLNNMQHNDNYGRDFCFNSNSIKWTTNYSQRHQCHHKQFPNSIELKFVDKMRRKFEFSVDSFQIILDSLIDFYDYAPQRTLVSSRAQSEIMNPRPLITSGVKCVECYVNSDNTRSLKNDLGLKPNLVTKKYEENHKNDNFHQNDFHKHRHLRHHHQHSHQSQNYHNQHIHDKINNSFLNNANSTSALNDNQHSYYQLSMDRPNSQSIPSSSGCSSSSSVVSSSASSSSCDEDNDLCCENDLTTSSNSSSSLISSPTISSLSLNGSYAMSEQFEQDGKVHSIRESEHNEGKLGKVVVTERNTTGRDTLFKESFEKEMLFGRMNSMAAKEGNTLMGYNNCIDCFKQNEQILNINNCINDFDLNITPCAVISENFYPTVIGRSEYGNFKEALYHLEKKLIATRSPEEIRGGGLLKYCNLLVKNYKPKNIYQIRTLERYMCSRFFIDFSDLNQQQAKLESYLRNHFSDDPVLKFDYLTILYNVVQRSTVCLMNHELRLTLNMIRELAYKLTTGFRQLYVNRM